MPINYFWIIRQKECLKLMFILERSWDWSTTMKCRWTWHHYAIINPTSTMNRVVVRQDLYIVFRNWTKFILYSLLTIPFECCFSWPTRKRWCVCLHMTSRFYEIYIVVNDRNVVLKFLDLCTKIQYFIWSVQNNVSVLFMKVFYFPTYVVFTIIVMLAPTHFSLAWG